MSDCPLLTKLSSPQMNHCLLSLFRRSPASQRASGDLAKKQDFCSSSVHPCKDERGDIAPTTRVDYLLAVQNGDERDLSTSPPGASAVENASRVLEVGFTLTSPSALESCQLTLAGQKRSHRHR